MKYIAVFCRFLTDEHRRTLEAAASRWDYAVDYYTHFDQVPAEKLPLYEIIYGNLSPRRVREFPNLHWLCLDSAGADKYVDESIYPNPDVVLTNSSGAYGVTISEHVLMVTLMLLRHMPLFQASAAAHAWHPAVPIRSIYGSRITVLGTGDIGTAVAQRVKALGARQVVGVRRRQQPADPAFDRIVTYRELAEILPDTDILISAMPHTPETAGIISRENIALLPPHALIVNVGRGTAVDQEALAEALRGGKLAGAALDVMVPEPLPAEHPLWTTPNLLLTPHISGNMSLPYTCDIDVELFCEDLARFAQGQPLHQVVNRNLGY